jgi:hypothetical protein
MAFEKFTQTARSYRAKVSIRPNGTLGFNSGAVQKFGLDKAAFAILYYDKERNRIGIQPVANEAEEGANKINKGKTGAWLAARRFLDYYEINTEEKSRHNATWDEREGMIIVDLNK